MKQAEILALVTDMLPEHYTITQTNKPKHIAFRCVSKIGLANNDGNEDTEQWGYFMDALRTRLGERFMEVDHNTCHNHVDFVVYVRQDLNAKDNALRELRKLGNILDTHGNILVPNLTGQTETTALERLVYFLEIIKEEFGVQTEEELMAELAALEENYPSK